MARYGEQGVELKLFILRPGQILAPASPVPILSSTQVRVQAKLLWIPFKENEYMTLQRSINDK